MPKAKYVFKDPEVVQGVCDYLEIEGCSPYSGEMLGCYCSKYLRDLPNSQTALIYCALYKKNGYNCYFNL